MIDKSYTAYKVNVKSGEAIVDSIMRHLGQSKISAGLYFDEVATSGESLPIEHALRLMGLPFKHIWEGSSSYAEGTEYVDENGLTTIAYTGEGVTIDLDTFLSVTNALQSKTASEESRLTAEAIRDEYVEKDASIRFAIKAIETPVSAEQIVINILKKITTHMGENDIEMVLAKKITGYLVGNVDLDLPVEVKGVVMPLSEALSEEGVGQIMDASQALASNLQAIVDTANSPR